MQGYAVKQSSTAYPLVFLMIQSSDHISGLTGATPTVTISKNGGAFASPAGAVSEIGNGWYKVAGNATDTNTLGPILLHATAAGGDPVDMMFAVVAVDPQATSFGLSLAKTTNITGFNDIAATAVVSAGAITTSGGKVSGVVLVDTLTTYTGNTPQTGDAYARIGATGSGLTSLAPASTALSTANWTTARAGYLDNLNVGGVVASHADAATLSTQVGTPMQAGNVTVGAYAAGQDPASLVLDATASAHNTAGTIGADINAAGSLTAGVTVATNNDKTGYSLASTGLDAIGTTAPTGAASTFPQMLVQVWRRLFKGSAKSATGNTLKTFADDGTTVLTTQAWTDDGAGNETLGAAS